MLVHSDSVPDLPGWEAVLEFPMPGRQDEASKAAISNAADVRTDTGATGSRLSSTSASNVSSSATQLQTDESELAGNADVKHQSRSPQTASRLSDMRLEALLNYTHEQLQALSNPGGLSTGSLQQAQRQEADQAVGLAQAPLLTVATSQLETVSRAEALAGHSSDLALHALSEVQQSTHQPSGGEPDPVSHSTGRHRADAGATAVDKHVSHPPSWNASEAADLANATAMVRLAPPHAVLTRCTCCWSATGLGQS